MHIASVGIDLGKATFHLVALGERNKVLVRKKFSRAQLLSYTANLPASLIGLEACAGAHFMGTALREQGHEVRLIPAQFVKPYRKSNKNDFLDAEAIAEAVTKENMRFCAEQDPGAARCASHAPRSGSAGAASHGTDQ
jgi:transposase